MNFVGILTYPYSKQRNNIRVPELWGFRLSYVSSHVFFVACFLWGSKKLYETKKKKNSNNVGIQLSFGEKIDYVKAMSESLFARLVNSMLSPLRQVNYMLLIGRLISITGIKVTQARFPSFVCSALVAAPSPGQNQHPAGPPSEKHC